MIILQMIRADYKRATHQSGMAGENFAGNIIASLAGLPDFLRRPILTKRMTEFFAMPHDEKIEIIENALEAGPTVDFDRFEKLFKTWLEILAGLPPEQRAELVGAYVSEIAHHPEKLVAFNMDAIFGIFLTLRQDQRDSIAGSVRDVIYGIDDGGKALRRIRLVVPDLAQEHMGISIQ